MEYESLLLSSLNFVSTCRHHARVLYIDIDIHHGDGVQVSCVIIAARAYLITHNTVIQAYLITHNTVIQAYLITHNTVIQAYLITHNTVIQAYLITQNTVIQAYLIKHNTVIQAYLQSRTAQWCLIERAPSLYTSTKNDQLGQCDSCNGQWPRQHVKVPALWSKDTVSSSLLSLPMKCLYGLLADFGRQCNSHCFLSCSLVGLSWLCTDHRDEEPGSGPCAWEDGKRKVLVKDLTFFWAVKLGFVNSTCLVLLVEGWGSCLLICLSFRKRFTWPIASWPYPSTNLETISSPGLVSRCVTLP